ncbi:hypothetical protein Tco_0086199 [Tanacetum coccineum]
MRLQQSERPSEALPTPSPAPTSDVPNEPQTDSSLAQTSEVPFEQQTDQSLRPSPTTTIPDSIPETSSENLGGYSSSDKSLSGNEGDMTIQGVYDLCLSLCKQVSDQAKEIQALKAQITKLKKQAKPVIKHHKDYLKSVSLKQRFLQKSFSKKHRVQPKSVIQTRGICKRQNHHSKRSFHLIEILEDTLVPTSEGVRTDEKVSTDFEKVSTDRPKVSTDDSKVSTDEQVKGTEEQSEGTEEIFESTEEQREGTEEKVSTDGQIDSTEDQTKEEIASKTS